MARLRPIVQWQNTGLQNQEWGFESLWACQLAVGERER